MKLNPWRRRHASREEVDLAELGRLLPAPGEPVLSYDRQLVLEERLMSEIRADVSASATASVPWSRVRSRYFVVPVVLLALGGGAIAAHLVLADESAEATGMVRCFPSASLRGDSTDSEAMPEDDKRARRDPSSTVETALVTCARLWEAGLIRPSGPVSTEGWKQPVVIPSATPGRGKVPPLAACVLGDGQAAVFPGDERRTCQGLGLARLADRR